MKKVILKILSFFILIMIINKLNVFIFDSYADLSEEGWSKEIRLTNNEFHSIEPQIAVSGSNIHVVWEDNRDGKYGIFYIKSENNGTNWSEIVKLSSENDYHNMVPSIAINGNNIHVVWGCDKNVWEIYYKRSLDNGKTWLPETIVSEDDGESSWIPKIDVENNLIFITWGDFKDNNCAEVYLIKSIDNGENWSPIKKLSDIDGESSQPNDIVVNGDNVYIVWYDDKNVLSDEIYFSKSNDLGENWSLSKRLSKNDGIYSIFASIAANGSNIHVVWDDQWGANYEIGYTRSIDGGENWDKYIRLSADDGFTSSYSDIAVNGENIHVIWTDHRDGTYEIYYKKSFNNGENWEPEIRITEHDEGGAGGARMDIFENYIYLVWDDNRDGNFEIYYRQKGNAPPKLSLGNVNPTYGNILTSFDYTVIYTDVENDPPLYVYVNIDGINYSMNETNKDDASYVDGKEYFYLAQLNKSEFHTYYFLTSDGNKCFRTVEILGPLVDTGPPSHIEIIPAFDKITTDDYIKFISKIFDSDYNILNVTPKWEVNGGGVIDEIGNFTATTPGNWTIFANISEISGSAIVNITLGKLHKIDIYPHTSEITTDDYIQYNANGYDSDGNLIQIDPKWEVSGGGIIDEEGNFTAIIPGTFFVYANDSGINSTAIIKIIVGKLKNINITPPQVSITTDDYVQFSAIGYDADENLIEISPTWETTGGGIINETGYFDATIPGSWIVYANFSNVSGIAALNITIGKLVKLEISPPFLNVNVGDSIQFSVKGYDADGNLMNTTPNWKVSGGGSIDHTGNYSAKEAGNWTVTATQNGVSTTINITVNPPDDEPEPNGKDPDEVSKNSLIFIAIGVIIIIVIIIVTLFFKTKKGKKNNNSSKDSKLKKVKTK